MKTIFELLEMLSLYGGKIVCTSSLSPHWINQAREGGRMYVNEHGIGFVYEPNSDFPETEEEVKRFEQWFPLKPENPMPFIDPDKIIEKARQRENIDKQIKEN